MADADADSQVDADESGVSVDDVLGEVVIEDDTDIDGDTVELVETEVL